MIFDSIRGIYAHVTWNDNSNNEDGFIVEQWHRSGTYWVLDFTYSVGPNVTVADVQPLRAKSTYFRVKAFNLYGESSWSNWAHVTNY